MIDLVSGLRTCARALSSPIDSALIEGTLARDQEPPVASDPYATSRRKFS